jgi:hypothetical protein
LLLVLRLLVLLCLLRLLHPGTQQAQRGHPRRQLGGAKGGSQLGVARGHQGSQLSG